jgi:hypothetical protein
VKLGYEGAIPDEAAVLCSTAGPMRHRGRFGAELD